VRAQNGRRTEWQAGASDAEDSGVVVAGEPAGEANQDRREGGQQWLLRHVPVGRCQHPVAGRRA
jgi:hypothetical protein